MPRVFYFTSYFHLYRHPEADQRPNFGDIVQQLQKPDFHILKWSAEDKNLCSKEAQTLGSPLHLGKELYKDQQGLYLPNEVSTNN